MLAYAKKNGANLPRKEPRVIPAEDLLEHENEDLKRIRK
jgi:hypothetical protein